MSSNVIDNLEKKVVQERWDEMLEMMRSTNGNVFNMKLM